MSDCSVDATFLRPVPAVLVPPPVTEDTKGGVPPLKYVQSFVFDDDIVSVFFGVVFAIKGYVSSPLAISLSLESRAAT